MALKVMEADRLSGHSVVCFECVVRYDPRYCLCKVLHALTVNKGPCHNSNKQPQVLIFPPPSFAVGITIDICHQSDSEM